MTNRTNPQHGANMVDRYIGSAFDIVYAVYKELDSFPLFIEFVAETSPRMEAQYADIIERFDHIVQLEASALDSKEVAVKAAEDALEYRDTTQALIDDANKFRDFVENVVENTIQDIQDRFENTIQDIQDRFAEFVVVSGYQFIGNYGPGIKITEYNQLVRDLDGEFWRLSGERTLPYVTTGAGIIEEDAFIPVGDASLRQHLKNPTLGSNLVQYDENNTVKDAIDRNREDFWANKETLGGVYTHYVREDDGDPISGAECAVYVGGTGVLATNLRDKHGAPLANPFTTGEDGLVQFIADPGKYTLQVFFDRIVHKYSVYFADDGLRNDLANATAPDKGAKLIGYKGSTVEERLDGLGTEVLASAGAAQDALDAAAAVALVANEAKDTADLALGLAMETSVETFNGRAGVVVPESGDYTAEQITRGTGTVESALRDVEATVAQTLNNLGTAATRDVLVSSTDVTSGALMAVGAFGLGGLNIRISETNLNDLSRTGFYMGWKLVNAPLESNDWFYVLHQEHGGAGFSSQFAIDLNSSTPKIYQRQKTVGIWRSWYEVWNSSTLPVTAFAKTLLNVADAAATRATLGAVSSTDVDAKFTGANVSLAENGYQILPSGLIIQWGTFTGVTTADVTASFPIAFTVACLNANIMPISATVNPTSSKAVNVPVKSVTTTQITLKAGPDTGYYGGNFYWFAVGY